MLKHLPERKKRRKRETVKIMTFPRRRHDFQGFRGYENHQNSQKSVQKCLPEAYFEKYLKEHLFDAILMDFGDHFGRWKSMKMGIKKKVGKGAIAPTPGIWKSLGS